MILKKQKQPQRTDGSPVSSSSSSSLCQVLKGGKHHRIDCHRVEQVDEGRHLSLEVARIVPTSNAVTPVSEAIVVVVPPPPPTDNDWYRSGSRS